MTCISYLLNNTDISVPLDWGDNNIAPLCARIAALIEQLEQKQPDFFQFNSSSDWDSKALKTLLECTLFYAAREKSINWSEVTNRVSTRLNKSVSEKESSYLFLELKSRACKLELSHDLPALFDSVDCGWKEWKRSLNRETYEKIAIFIKRIQTSDPEFGFASSETRWNTRIIKQFIALCGWKLLEDTDVDGRIHPKSWMAIIQQFSRVNGGKKVSLIDCFSLFEKLARQIACLDIPSEWKSRLAPYCATQARRKANARGATLASAIALPEISGVASSEISSKTGELIRLVKEKCPDFFKIKGGRTGPRYKSEWDEIASEKLFESATLLLNTWNAGKAKKRFPNGSWDIIAKKLENVTQKIGVFNGEQCADRYSAMARDMHRLDGIPPEFSHMVPFYPRKPLATAESSDDKNVENF